MYFPISYKCLNKNNYVRETFRLIPIRYEDRNNILKWRNKQINILRQKERLSVIQQDSYFQNIVYHLFSQDCPEQLLFSFLDGEKLIGYGGLVHINWKDKNAEISFLVANDLNDRDNYLKLFTIFLKLLKEIALDLKLHKIYSYGYDIEAYRFEPLSNNSFKNEVILKYHINIDGCLHDIKIYSLLLSS